MGFGGKPQSYWGAADDDDDDDALFTMIIWLWPVPAGTAGWAGRFLYILQLSTTLYNVILLY